MIVQVLVCHADGTQSLESRDIPAVPTSDAENAAQESGEAGAAEAEA